MINKMVKILSIFVISIFLMCIYTLNNDYIKTNIVKADDTPTEIADVTALQNFLTGAGTSGKLTGNDYVLSDTIQVNGTKTLDLNGKTISSSSTIGDNKSMFIIPSGASLTIKSNGIVDGNNKARLFDVNSGTLIINAGTYKNGYDSRNTECSGGIYNNGGTIKIEGTNDNKVVFENNRAKLYGTLYSKNSENVSINNAIIKGTTETLQDSYCAGTIRIEGINSPTSKEVSISNTVFKDINTGTQRFNHGIDLYNVNSKLENIEIIDYRSNNVSYAIFASSGNLNLNTKATINNITFQQNSTGLVQTNNILIGLTKQILEITGQFNSNVNMNILNGVDLGDIEHQLILDGTFNLSNDARLFINIQGKGFINVKNNFSTNRKLEVLGIYPNGNENTVKNSTGDSSINLKDKFDTMYSYAYFETKADKSLKYISVNVTEYPSASNNYTIKTDIKNDAPINIKTTWYGNNVNSYQKIAGQGTYGDITISVVTGGGTYDQTTESWKINDTTPSNNKFMFKIKANSPGRRLLVFEMESENTNYSMGAGLFDATISDVSQVMNFLNTTAFDDKSIVMLELKDDKEYGLVLATKSRSTSTWTSAKIKNIYVYNVGTSYEIAGENSLSLSHPFANSFLSWKLEFARTDRGYVEKYNSPIYSLYYLFFGNVKNDSPTIKPKTEQTITYRTDVDDTDYSYFDTSGNVYIDNLSQPLTKNLDYTYSKGSIILNIKPNIVKQLGEGKHTFYIKKSATPGAEYAAATLLVQNNPAPSPSHKDESCEKVIGPTWHWNNDKGICEDIGVVGTSTR